MNRENEIKKIAEYFDELLWEFEKLSKTELNYEQKLNRIGEKLNLPSEFLSDWFNRNVGQVIA